MDTAEVESVLAVLVKKGYLNEDYKPIKQVTQERVEPTPPQQVMEPKGPQAKHIVPSEGERTAQDLSSENELIENLIASKMRDGLKSKIQVKESEAITWDQPKDILDEWERLSKSLWDQSRKEKRSEPSRPTEPQKSETKKEGKQEKKTPREPKKPKKEPFNAEDALKELREL